MSDLVQQLIDAAAAAIANERPSLEHRPGTVRGLTIELALDSRGLLGEATVFVERRTRGPSLLGRPVRVKVS